jgi:hypothetical protein
MHLVVKMHRFLVYMIIEGKSDEICIAEGIQFTNDNLAVYEYLSQTILILDSIEALIKHYSSVGEVNIEWVDLLTYKKNIH